MNINKYKDKYKLVQRILREFCKNSENHKVIMRFQEQFFIFFRTTHNDLFDTWRVEN